jgi:hypothetical protein
VAYAVEQRTHTVLGLVVVLVHNITIIRFLEHESEFHCTRGPKRVCRVESHDVRGGTYEEIAVAYLVLAEDVELQLLPRVLLLL